MTINTTQAILLGIVLVGGNYVFRYIYKRKDRAAKKELSENIHVAHTNEEIEFAQAVLDRVYQHIIRTLTPDQKSVFNKEMNRLSSLKFQKNEPGRR